MQVAARFSGKGQAYEGLAYRNSSGAHWTGKVRLVEEHLEDPLRWKRPRRIFVNSMSDLFHESLDEYDIGQVFAIMALAKQHTFQVLTKRPAEMLQILETARICFDYDEPLPNVWLGVSVEDQKTADERIPLLLQTPAAVRWLSVEPLLGPIELQAPWSAINPEYPEHGIHWVVVGGESGPGARPMHPDWARSIRDECVAAGVPFFFKQWGEWEPFSLAPPPDTPTIDPAWHDWRQGDFSARVGKKAAGRLLDGREWNEYPNLKGIIHADSN
jgi:protein gp37